MKQSILVLILIFSLQSLTKADDIRDFQIEGMSIGDSALNIMTKKEIKETLSHKHTFFYKKKVYNTIFSEIIKIYKIFLLNYIMSLDASKE